MAQNKKISDLVDVGAPTNTDYTVLIRGGIPYKVQYGNIVIETTGSLTSGNLIAVLNNYATTGSLTGYVTFPVLSGYVTTGALGTYITTGNLIASLNNYLTTGNLTATLNNYATLAILAGYATTGSLTGYVTLPVLTGYVTTGSLANTLTGYIQVGSIAQPTGNLNDLTSITIKKHSAYNDTGNWSINLIGAGSSAQLMVGTDTGNSVSYIQSMVSGSTNSFGAPLVLQPNSGKTFIGTLTGSAALEVKGTGNGLAELFTLRSANGAKPFYVLENGNIGVTSNTLVSRLNAEYLNDVSGGFYQSHQKYSSISNFFGANQLYNTESYNALYRADERFNINGSGFTTFSTPSLFNSSFQAAAIVPATGTGILTIDITPEYTNGFTYSNGNFYVSFYGATPPAAITGRVQRTDDTWFGLTNIEDISNAANSILYKLTSPSFNNLKTIELTVVAPDSLFSRISQVEFHPFRSEGTVKFPLVSKMVDNVLYSNFQVNNANTGSVFRVTRASNAVSFGNTPPVATTTVLVRGIGATTNEAFRLMNSGSGTFLRVTDNGIMRLTGQLGIGADAPLAPLHIRSAQTAYNAATGAFTITNETHLGSRLNLGIDTGILNSGAFIQSLKTTALASNLHLNPNGGNVGVNVLLPQEAFHVSGGFLQSGKFYVASNSSVQTLVAGTQILANFTKATITGAGNLVSTASPALPTGGRDGQIIFLLGAPATNITFQADSVLNGTRLRIGATGRSVGPNTVWSLLYDLGSNYWYEHCYSNNV